MSKIFSGAPYLFSALPKVCPFFRGGRLTSWPKRFFSMPVIVQQSPKETS